MSSRLLKASIRHLRPKVRPGKQSINMKYIYIYIYSARYSNYETINKQDQVEQDQ